jgi:hypothetical protein
MKDRPANFPLDNRLLIATHSASRRLCLYRVGIKWNPQPETKQPAQQPFPVPAFQILHTKIEEPSGIFPRQENQLDILDDSSPKEPHHFHLTHLDILQSTGEYQDETNPVLIGVFVSTLGSELSLPRGSLSVIARWELKSGPLDLHSSFDEVASKKGNVKPNVGFVLSLLVPIHRLIGFRSNMNLEGSITCTWIDSLPQSTMLNQALRWLSFLTMALSPFLTRSLCKTSLFHRISARSLACRRLDSAFPLEHPVDPLAGSMPFCEMQTNWPRSTSGPFAQFMCCGDFGCGSRVALEISRAFLWHRRRYV